MITAIDDNEADGNLDKPMYNSQLAWVILVTARPKGGISSSFTDPL